MRRGAAEYFTRSGAVVVSPGRPRHKDGAQFQIGRPFTQSAPTPKCVCPTIPSDLGLRADVGGCWAGEPACEDWQELGGWGARLYGVDDQTLVGVIRW